MRKQLIGIVCGAAVAFLSGCGGTSNTPHPPAGTPTFSPAAGTYTAAQSVTISSGTQGSAIYYTTDGTTPTASSAKYAGAVTVGTSETLEAIAVSSGQPNSAVGSAQYVINLAPPSVSASTYTFPSDTIGNALVETVATVNNPGASAVTLATTISGDASLTLVSGQGCGATLAAGASCDLVAQYLPSAAGTVTGTVTVSYSGPSTGSATVALSGTATNAVTGMAAATSNPLVALFSVTPGDAATVTVQFGADTTYGYTTMAVPTPTANAAGQVQVEVAGMKQQSTYHMRAAIAYTGGSTVYTPDTTFTTGTLPADLAALQMTATTAAGMTPQPGIELLDPLELSLGQGTQKPYATDLQGNVIWYYPWPDNPQLGDYFQDGIKQLPNSDFLLVLGIGNNDILTSPYDTSKIYIREIDLIGNTVKQLSLATLNTKLAAANVMAADGSGPLVLGTFHHDVEPLPNGHWLIMSNTLETINGTKVAGDVVVDVDTNMNPVWEWNEFAHFDASDASTLAYPDWTHSNAIIYTPTDGNFLVSMRHLNLVVKVKYLDGSGDGSVIWKLGNTKTSNALNNGTLSLVDTVDPLGNSPYDWQYAQHLPAIVGSTSAGTFQLTMMDNGDDRYYKTNTACPANDSSKCYTTIPLFQIDEDAQTATMVSRVTLPPNLFSNFGGNAEVLANDDLEYDICNAPGGAQIVEDQQDTNHTQVWSLTVHGLPIYRGLRLPSLYSGIQWP